jgi:general secretion pathway protein K
MNLATMHARRWRTAPDGFIVIAVLWMLAALAALVAIYAVYVIDTASIFRVHDDRLRAQGLTTAALELTVSRLSRSSGTRPSHGRFDLRLGQADLAVEFSSEAARIDLNAAPRELLSGLFGALGTPREAANQYAQRIIAWRAPPSKDGEGEAAAHQSAGLPYARGAPFSHVNELSLVPGLPAALIEGALPFVTVYSGRSQIDVVNAAPKVLAALPGMTPGRLKDFLVLRQLTAGDAHALIALLGTAQVYATTESTKAFRVKSAIAFDHGSRLSSEVVILVLDDAPEPFAVLSWDDEPDQSRSKDPRGTGPR